LIDPLLKSSLQFVQYTFPSYTTQENQLFVKAQNYFNVRTDVNCPGGGYMTYQFTASPTTTGLTYSGNIDLNRCIVPVVPYAETATYESGAFGFSGSLTAQVSDNTTVTAEIDQKDRGEAMVTFRGQSYSIQTDLESKAKIQIIVSTGRTLYTSDTVGTVRINGYPYQISLHQEFTTP